MSQRSSSKFTTRTNFSESASSENQPYADTLANKLLNLHEENIQIGKQNQELSVRLHEVTTYNQALGLDIYKLDNQINDLEEKIESHREKTTKILHQTEVMNKKTERCKNVLNRNEQMSDLAKKFQKISHFKEKADKNVQELHKLFEDSNYEKIANSFDIIAEKIHFLYWNNNELNEQINMLEKLVTEKENTDRTQFKSSWEERRIDTRSISQNGKDIKSESSPASGASLRAKMKKRIQKAKSAEKNLKSEEESTTLQAQSDASKKNEYFISSDSMENEFQKKINNNNNQQNNDQQNHAINSPASKKLNTRKNRKGKKSRKTKNSNENENKGENEYETNEYEEQKQIKFSAENMTPRKNLRYRKQPSPKSASKENEKDEESQINDDTSPHSKSSSTTYSKSSSKSTHSDKSNQPQSPNSCMDTSSQLADSSNSNNSNNSNNNDEFQQIQLVHSNYKAPYQSMSDANDFSRNGRRLSRRKRAFPQKNLNQIKDSDSEYDFFESEPPPNPKKGTVRESKNDSEYEYEYYDPDDEIADDENEYDFVDENSALPKVIISRPKYAEKIIENKKKPKEPEVITNYTECEYHLLNITKADPIKVNSEDGEKLIKLNSKYDEDENVHHNYDKSEYIYIKKSEKTMKEDQIRKKQREFVPVTRIPKIKPEELRQEKNDVFDEEQIKKYEENALRRALEDEENDAQKKIEEESKAKDEEEQFIKKCFKNLRKLKKKKREKMEKMKDDEIQLYKENRKLEKNYMNRVTEIINMKEERELNKAIEEENENLNMIDKIKKAKKRIETRKKEEEAIKEQENIQKLHKKEAEDKLIEEKRIKARKFKEEELQKLKQKEKEETENKEREKQKRIYLLKLTQEKEREKIENERKKKEKEDLDNKERERLAIEDMARRRQEKEIKEQQEKENEKIKRANEVQILKSKIMKFRQLKEKEKKEKEEEKNNEQEVELIKQKLREKRRRERELREEEKIERERKDRELRELYEGIFDVPVKRIFDKNEQDNDTNKVDDSYFRNSRLGNDRDGFLSDSAGMSASDSMAELDVAAPISLEERKLAELHDKNSSHSHSNCKRIKVRKNKNGNESDYEYEYEYEYECDDDEQQSKSKSRSNSKLKPRSKSGLNNHEFSESESESIISKSKNNRNKQVDEEEAEQIALQEQQRLQQLLKQMDNQNNKEKGKNKDKSKRNRPKSNLDSSSKFEKDSSIVDASHSSPKENNNDESLLNYSYKINDYNSASNSSDVIQYSDDDYFPRPKEIIKTRSNKNDEEDGEESTKNKNSSNAENNIKSNDLIINEKNRPLRKQKTEKPKFVPEFYNLKQQPKFKPIVVGTIKTNDQNSDKNTNDITKMGTIVNEIDNPETPKPILIENCKIKHPGPVQMDGKNFQIIKTPEQIQKEKEEKAAREERERLHAERAKKFRHSIDANGKEYEYDYEYDYEYETENENKEDNNSNENKDTNNLHATYRDSTDFLNELSKEVANANAVIRQTTDVIKHDDETKEKKEEEEEEMNDSENKKEKNKVKKVRTGRKIKKLPSTAKPSQVQIKLDNQNSDNDNNNAGIKKQRSVTFANNPAFDNENQVNFNPSANNANRTPQKRIINSARRQRNSPGSPIIDPTISPNSKQRLSNRRHFSDMIPSDNNNNNEEEEDFYEDEYEQIPKPNNLLVEIDSRPDTPRKPQQPNSTTTPTDYETPNVPELDLSKIPNFVDDEYEYEYEYEYENDDNKKDSAKSNKNKSGTNDDEKLGISENGSSTSNNLLLKKDNSDEDFTENEKTFDSRSNFKLQNLVKQVRADAASLSNEDLQNILTKIKAEVEVQLKSNTELEEKLQELEKIRDKKVPKKLSNFSTRILEFDPIIYENKYHSADCQTEVPGEFIKNIEATLQKQNKEKQEMIAIQKRIEAAQQQVINTDGQIKSAEKLTIEKKQSIENLKAEIIKVKEEIAQLNYDTTQDDVQAKQCEIEIEKLDTQVQQQQIKLEKVTHTIEELRVKLQEMINYRSVLEAELNDIYNREKPEVRKLIEDVRNTKQSSEEAQTKITQLQKKIATRRDEINKLKKSQERKKNDELRLVKEKLSRRLNKWTVLNNSNNLDLKSLQEFSLDKASQREKAKNEAYTNMKKNWSKNDDVESITKYADLLENIITEYNKQTVT